MSESEKPAAVDSLLEDLGGCGRFQVLIVSAVMGSLFSLAWSILFMAGGLYNPGWRCDTPESTLNASLVDNSTTGFRLVDNSTALRNTTEPPVFSKTCANYSLCENVVYSQDSSTIVTEWDLACDNAYITSLMISVEMGGTLLGALVAGHVNNVIGRKLTHYLTLLAHSLLHVVTAFSLNWQMFAACRLLIGITDGFLVLSIYLYAPEFITPKWRGITAALPIWTAGTVSFALMAMLLRDWRHMHLATAVLSSIFLLPSYWVPESLRWLAVKGRLEKADRVGAYIAKFNRNSNTNYADISDVVSAIARDERKRELEKPKMTIIDLYRRVYRKRTVVTASIWLCNMMVYFTMLYSARSLSGDFYINLLLMVSIIIIASPITAVLTSTIGRRYTCLVFLGVSALSCISLFGVHFINRPDIDKGLIKFILSLVVVICVEGTFCAVALYTVELFPTTMRSLGLSHATCVGRVGAIISPYLIPTDESTLYISHIILAVGIVVTITALMLLPETKDTVMEDAMVLTAKETRRAVYNEQEVMV